MFFTRFPVYQTFQLFKHFIHKATMSDVRPVVMSGPSGSGKSTLVKRLMNEYKDVFALSISHTSRKPREGEVNGREYHFVDRNEMQRAIENDEFIEHAEFSGNMYGTSKKSVEDVQSSGRICLLDIDMQGVKSIKKTRLNPKYIFVKPPNMTVLEKRLRSRGSESEDNIKRRLKIAEGEMVYGAEKGAYDHVILNDDLDIAYEKLKGTLMKRIDQVIKDKHAAR